MKIRRIVALLWVGVYLTSLLLPATSAKYYHSESRELTIVWSQPVTSGSLVVTAGVNSGYYALACYGGGGGNYTGGRGGSVRAIVQLGPGTYYVQAGGAGVCKVTAPVSSVGGQPGGATGFAPSGYQGGGGGGYSFIGTVNPLTAANMAANIVAIAGGGGGGAGTNGTVGENNIWGGRGGDVTAANAEAPGNSSSGPNLQNGMASDVGPATGTNTGDYPRDGATNHERWGRAAGGGRNSYAAGTLTFPNTTTAIPNGGGRRNRGTGNGTGTSGAGTWLNGGAPSNLGSTGNSDFAGGGGGGYRGGGGGGYHHNGNNQFHPGGGGGGSSYLSSTVATIVNVVQPGQTFADYLASDKLAAWVDGHTEGLTATAPAGLLEQPGKAVLIYLGPDDPRSKTDDDFLFNW